MLLRLEEYSFRRGSTLPGGGERSEQHQLKRNIRTGPAPLSNALLTQSDSNRYSCDDFGESKHDEMKDLRIRKRCKNEV